jgi:flagellar assembly protein FliH
MISPSEGDVVGTASVGSIARLLNRGSQRGKGDVSRLAFHSVEKLVTEMAETVEGESVPAETETRLKIKMEMASLDTRLQEQMQQMTARIEAARSEARAEARRDWEEELEEKIAAERERMLQACEEFGRERAGYFAGVEAEVVKLALAIAARVLHREAKLDPLLLTAAVRVALEKVAEGSTTVLRVPVAEAEPWRGVFAAEPSVQVVGDERFSAGECVLDTNVGKVEMGVSAQLSEIERGFFDLLQQRPS